MKPLGLFTKSELITIYLGALKEIDRLRKIIEQVRQEVQEDVTCESRECGCDSYEECLECLKNTILKIIESEVKE